METVNTQESLRKLEVPGVIRFDQGGGGLWRANIRTEHSNAEVYLHGAQVTGFQLANEPPLLFLSRLSQFAPGKAIRGGIPICFPWFGPRDGDVMHGFARITEWELVETATAARGAATLKLRLPRIDAASAWPAFRAELLITVSDRLALELMVANLSSDQSLEFENCLHTYFAVGDISQVSIAGLQGRYYLDKTDLGARKREAAGSVCIAGETNRVYLDTTDTVEVRDGRWRRAVRVEKSGSASTVVWNPWTTQRMADFAPEEYQGMVCVESGNVGLNKLVLKPGEEAMLRVILSSSALAG